MKPEQRMWEQLRASIGDRWDASRHEDSISQGVPDVSFSMGGISGWLELKTVELPAKHETVIKVPHLTPVQKSWLRCRWTHGHQAWLLLKAGRWWMLFPGHKLENVGKMNWDGLREVVHAIWDETPEPTTLYKALKRPV